LIKKDKGEINMSVPYRIIKNILGDKRSKNSARGTCKECGKINDVSFEYLEDKDKHTWMCEDCLESSTQVRGKGSWGKGKTGW
jgi:hypothetical protein